MSRSGPIRTLLPLVLLAPVAAFLIAATRSGLDPASAISAALTQLITTPLNLSLLSLLGVLPLLALGGALRLGARVDAIAARLPGLAWYGGLPVLGVQTYLHLQFWPLFFPARTPPGFPHGLELVLGPLIHAPGAMLAGLALGWLLIRRP